MFLIITFPLIDQIDTCVTIYKIVSLSFKYSICRLLSNGQFYIAHILNIWIKNSKNLKLWNPHVPFLVHFNMPSPPQGNG
jgi:hypothetical protein